MVSRNLRSSILVVVLATAIVLSGCVGADTDTDATESPTTGTPSVSGDGAVDGTVAEQFEARLSSLDSYTATTTVHSSVGGNETTITTNIWARPATSEVRREVASSPYGNGTVTVVNESLMVTYRPASNEVTRVDRSNYQQGGASGMGVTMLDSVVNSTNVEKLGTARLDGEKTYRVRLTPDSGTMGQRANVTAWLDAETYFPVRVQTTSTGSTNYTSVVEYTDVELNPTIPDSTFRLDTPADATVSEFSMPETRVYDSVSALQQNSSMSVPEPTLPDEFSLAQARETRGDYPSLTLEYRNDSDRLFVSKTDRSEYNRSADSETVQVGETTGSYTEFGASRMVIWSCDGHRYSVSGSVSKATLVETAASIECA